MTLALLWFILIAILWIGFFVLEGFDFGVGMLVGILGKKDKDRRVMINTIGPLWDGNEVWLITAGGAMFAAFPEWYATLFSGLYLPLFLILIALIFRGVAFEYRHKRESAAWQRGWDRCIIFGSFVPALVFGIGFANFVRGLPIVHDVAGRRWVMEGTVGNFFGLFMPYALLGGVLFVTLFLFHGAIFISLKTKGEIRFAARKFADRIGLVAIALLAIFSVWTAAAYGNGVVSWIAAVVAILAATAGYLLIKRGREGWAFTGTVLAIISMMVLIFSCMFPNVVPALDPVNDMSIQDAASTGYTLRIMTIASAVFLPIVLGYQAWTFWVFRKRISTQNLPVVESAEQQPTG
ncbi:cytochrome d ubiquinol oxidase subunit II [Enemella evansiae]|uniref:cytochrome d ubiquinol oxidase subunit II n=1 Tax=Enemella evansiae TaxID=2016499 RepID=UPI000B9615AF|nr:cytochrome d ubiquinol oxidase subunit II [Enemella evansiae]OYN96188.1 cytochrome d ubiquinol oxidase subunit II [Enemella evansiae]OYN99593.1 cytochrome d ubiquinol oxidase subunit II [Enemella evansiae]PFG65410.1 cytochrome bd-I ubiquinol oxidase subunit 2 apoprotein [Propionibacteriaceae bacterium ES.041]